MLQFSLHPEPACMFDAQVKHNSTRVWITLVLHAACATGVWHGVYSYARSCMHGRLVSLAMLHHITCHKDEITRHKDECAVIQQHSPNARREDLLHRPAQQWSHTARFTPLCSRCIQKLHWLNPALSLRCPTGNRERYAGTEFGDSNLVDKAKIEVVVTRCVTPHGAQSLPTIFFSMAVNQS